jgi:hypothetical protein
MILYKTKRRRAADGLRCSCQDGCFQKGARIKFRRGGMKRYILSFIAMIFFSSVLLAQAGSIEDIKNKLNVKDDKEEEGEKGPAAGETFRIYSVHLTEMKNVHYQGAQQYTNQVYSIDVKVKFLKAAAGDKKANPDILKVYLFDRNKQPLGCLTRYFMLAGIKFVSDFKDFKINKTYLLRFDLDYALRKKVKYCLALLGSTNGEVVAMIKPKADLKEFDFAEKGSLKLP